MHDPSIPMHPFMPSSGGGQHGSVTQIQMTVVQMVDGKPVQKTLMVPADTETVVVNGEEINIKHIIEQARATGSATYEQHEQTPKKRNKPDLP